MNNDEVKGLQQKIADLKARWPAHSVAPSMWQQLEELEAALEEARKNAEKYNIRLVGQQEVINNENISLW